MLIQFKNPFVVLLNEYQFEFFKIGVRRINAFCECSKYLVCCKYVVGRRIFLGCLPYLHASYYFLDYGRALRTYISLALVYYRL